MDKRINFFLIGILMLLLAVVAVVSRHMGFAEKILTYSFGLFLLGSIFYLLELKDDQK